MGGRSTTRDRYFTPRKEPRYPLYRWQVGVLCLSEILCLKENFLPPAIPELVAIKSTLSRSCTRKSPSATVILSYEPDGRGVKFDYMQRLRCIFSQRAHPLMDNGDAIPESKAAGASGWPITSIWCWCVMNTLLSPFRIQYVLGAGYAFVNRGKGKRHLCSCMFYKELIFLPSDLQFLFQIK
jgi:hypothetical protein